MILVHILDDDEKVIEHGTFEFSSKIKGSCLNDIRQIAKNWGYNEIEVHDGNSKYRLEVK